MSDNPAVATAYQTCRYVDKDGNEWRRGLDGWFLDNVDGKGGVMLVYHHDMQAMIEKEHPQ
jgi:hypothetical protein